MEEDIYNKFKSYINHYSDLVNDFKKDIDKINALPIDQFYYCFTDQPIDECGLRYKKEDVKSSIGAFITFMNNIPLDFASNYLSTFKNSTAMRIYSKQKVDAAGPCGIQICNLSNLMTDRDRKVDAGIPKSRNIIELYLMYGDVTSYKDAICYAIATTAGFTDIIQLGYFNMGVACGCSTAKDTICLISVTAKFKDDSTTQPDSLTRFSSPSLCLASCNIEGYQPSSDDIDDWKRPTIVDQDNTEEKVSYEIFQTLNLLKTNPGKFYQIYGNMITNVTLLE